MADDSVMRMLFCNDCKTTKAIFLFVPSQRENGVHHCMSCQKSEREQLRKTGSCRKANRWDPLYLNAQNNNA